MKKKRDLCLKLLTIRLKDLANILKILNYYISIYLYNFYMNNDSCLFIKGSNLDSDYKDIIDGNTNKKNLEDKDKKKS